MNGIEEEDLFGLEFEDLIFEGESSRMMGDFDSAYIYLSKAILLQPTNPEPHEKMAITKIDDQDYVGALNSINNAINFDEFNWAYYFTRGDIYNELGEYNSCVEDYLKALKLIDNVPEDKNSELDRLLDRLGRSQLKLGDHKGAIETFSMSINLPHNMWLAEHYYERAKAKENLGLIEESIEDYNEAMLNFQRFPGSKEKEIIEIKSIISRLKP